MADFKLLSTEEIVALCRNFRKERPEPDPDHEAWKSELKLTPRMVADILDANNEV